MDTPLDQQFKTALETCYRFLGRELISSEIKKHSLYYQLVLKWNVHLNLTSITEPSSFVQRHILESLFLEKHIKSPVSEMWDLGTGLGVPGLVLSFVKPELPITLVESNKKKTIFLKEALDYLKITNVNILNSRLELITNLPPRSCVTARAVDRMENLIFSLIGTGLSADQYLFLLGGDLSFSVISLLPPSFRSDLIPIPLSDNRFLLSIYCST
jgi:16S rRNA (guanine527-N7)-methyltransferase